MISVLPGVFFLFALTSPGRGDLCRGGAFPLVRLLLAASKSAGDPCGSLPFLGVPSGFNESGVIHAAMSPCPVCPGGTCPFPLPGNALCVLLWRLRSVYLGISPLALIVNIARSFFSLYTAILKAVFVGRFAVGLLVGLLIHLLVSLLSVCWSVCLT